MYFYLNFIVTHKNNETKKTLNIIFILDEMKKWKMDV